MVCTIRSHTGLGHAQAAYAKVDTGDMGQGNTECSCRSTTWLHSARLGPEQSYQRRDHWIWPVVPKRHTDGSGLCSRPVCKDRRSATMGNPCHWGFAT